MKVVAAYLLAQLGGNAAPAAADITKILSAGAWRGSARSVQGVWAARHAAPRRAARRRARRGCRHAPSSPRRGAVNSGVRARRGAVASDRRCRNRRARGARRELPAAAAEPAADRFPAAPSPHRAGGIDSDAEASAQLLKALEGKDLAAVLAEGQKKLASVPSGGVGGGGAAAAPAAGGKAAAKEEKKEEEEEEIDNGLEWVVPVMKKKSKSCHLCGKNQLTFEH